MVMLAATLVVMMMLMVFVIVMMFVLVMVVSAATFIIVIMMMVLAMFMYMSTLRANFFLCHQLFFQRYRFFHNLKDLLSVKLLDWSCDDRCFCIDSTEKFHRLLCFLLINDICTAHNDRTCIFNLIVEELTEVSHVHLAFLSINYSCIAVQYDIYITLYTLYCFDNI